MSDSEKNELQPVTMPDSGRENYGSTDGLTSDIDADSDTDSVMPSDPPDSPTAVTGSAAVQQHNLKKTNTLVAAKDRAQLTATTAMSVVNVALLKELLDRGPDGNRYYTAVLWLICLSLAFQVLVGALSILVTNMRGYYKKYGDDLCEDLLSKVCCIKIVAERYEVGGHGKHGRQPGCKCCCLPMYITTDVNPAYEYKVIDEYNEWRSSATNDDIRQAELDVNLRYTLAAIEDVLDKLHKLQESTDAKEKTDTSQADYQSNVKKLKKATVDKFKNLLAQKELRMRRARGAVLSDKVYDIRDEHVLKEISFWQDIINYLLYFVFIFNAFIAGLGIFSGSSSSSDVAPDASVTGSVIVSP